MQLHEYEAELPTETFGFIEHLGSEFGVADRYGAVLGSTGLGRASDVTRLLRLLVSVGLAAAAISTGDVVVYASANAG